MLRRAVVGLVTTIALTVGALGLAGPAAAADEWEMPDVRGMSLERAVNTVLNVVGEDVDLDLRIQNRKDNREVINYQNWEVCAQGPGAGKNISQKTKRVILRVRRPDTRGCSSPVRL